MAVREVSIDITPPASASFAESALCYGVMQGRGVVLTDAYGVSVSDGLLDFLARLGCGVECHDGGIILTMRSGSRSEGEPIDSADENDFFRKMLMLARRGFDAPLRFPEDVSGSFETELIMYKRMGFDYELVDSGRSRLCRPILIPTRKMRYELPKKNYYLLDSLIAGVMTSGCVVELISPAEIDTSLWDAIPVMGVELKPVSQEAEEDELARRMSRLKALRPEFKYVIRRIDSSGGIDLRLPGDHMLAVAAAGAVCMARGSPVRFRNLLKTRRVLSAFRMLDRMGAGVSMKDSSTELPGRRCEVAVRPGALAGKRFGGDSVRACPEAFFVLASLGMIADGKTVIRGLPFGSELWRRRVGHVREILHSCGARVGEIEDGLVVESSSDLMMVDYLDTGDELCELLQQMLSLALPHHSTYSDPAHFAKSLLFDLYGRLGA